MKQLTALALVLVVGFAAFAAEKENPQVAKLAKDGHWLPQGWAKHEPMLGKPAPSLAMSDWINGEVPADKMKGQIVVVDFWATWCGPCKAGVPHNNETAKKYASKGVLVVGACGGGREEKMGEVVKETKMEYPTAKTTKETTDMWNVQWWPTYAIIDRNGTLRAIGVKPDYVEKIVDALLEEQPAAEKK